MGNHELSFLKHDFFEIHSLNSKCAYLLQKLGKAGKDITGCAQEGEISEYCISYQINHLTIVTNLPMAKAGYLS